MHIVFLLIFVLSFHVTLAEALEFMFNLSAVDLFKKLFFESK